MAQKKKRVLNSAALGGSRSGRRSRLQVPGRARFAPDRPGLGIRRIGDPAVFERLTCDEPIPSGLEALTAALLGRWRGLDKNDTLISTYRHSR